MNILIALDSFKGSLSAAQACEVVAQALASALPGHGRHCIPMADGGEGTAAALVAACRGQFVTLAQVSGPLPGQRVTARYGWLPESATAIVEMAEASGLPLVPADRRDPRWTTTRGTGEMLAHALARGAARIALTLGGSATHDGGTGAARALGWRFLDRAGRDLPEGGAALGRLARIVPPVQPLPTVAVEALCDVTNPLCGPSGAAAVYGPQKGATPALVQELDAALLTLADRLRADLGVDVASLPGAGAAGGFGAGAVAFLGARLVRGVDAVAEVNGLTAGTSAADWILTGEGRFDSQSLQGKVVSGVLCRALAAGKPVAVLAGSVALDRQAWQEAGVSDVEACTPAGMSLEEAMRRAPELLDAATCRLARRRLQAQ